MCLFGKERRNLKNADFELVDETEKGGAKIVFKVIQRRLTIEANRRCRSGAVSWGREIGKNGVAGGPQRQRPG